MRSPVSNIFFLVFDVTVLSAFPLLYNVLHHSIFTNVHHFNLYRSSLYIHPEFSDGINYLSLSLLYILLFLTLCNFLQYLMLYYVHKTKILLYPLTDIHATSLLATCSITCLVTGPSSFLNGVEIRSEIIYIYALYIFLSPQISPISN